MTQTWNSGQKNANIVLSNGSLTATMTTNNSTECAVFATEGFTTGKFYWEDVVTGTGVAANETGAGIGNISSSTANGQWIGVGTDTLGWYGGTGNLNNNGVHILTNSSWATWATGARLCFALDLDNKLFWGRVSNGNWNNNASANPATGTLGVAIPSAVTAAAVVPGASLFSTTTPDAHVASFAQTSWVFTPPAGFWPFDPIAYNPGMRQLGPILAQ